MKQIVHYRPATHKYKHFCLDCHWSGSLTREEYIALWKAGKVPPTTTHIGKVTCYACLREMRAVINKKLLQDVPSS
jgi:hypothetical protein